MIKAIIFDLDDTLYNYKECNEIALKEVEQYAKNKYGIEKNDFSYLFSRAREIVKERLGRVAASHNRMLYLQTFLELAGKNPITGALEMYDLYWNSILKNMTLFEYVIPLMEDIKARGCAVGILSDLTAHIQHRKILQLQLERYVDALVTSEEAGAEKPDRAAFELIVEKLGVSPCEALMIGDSESRDIAGALDFGMKSLLFNKDMQFSIKRKLEVYFYDKTADIKI